MSKSRDRSRRYWRRWSKGHVTVTLSPEMRAFQVAINDSLRRLRALRGEDR